MDGSHRVSGGAHEFPAVRGSASDVTLPGRCTPTAETYKERWARHAARMGEAETPRGFWWKT